jgi:DNA-directed RNA polymerase specialized sigma24 family protein
VAKLRELGFTYGEIALALGVKLDTIKKRFRRFKARQYAYSNEGAGDRELQHGTPSAAGQ